jgi:Uma2 family endonuclease
MSTAARSRAPAVDPTIYPIEGDVGEDSLQTFITELLRPLIEGLLASRKVKAFVGADQYIYWKQYEPTKCVAPDVYVLPGVTPEARVRTWKVWQKGIVPSFALEVVSDDASKDVEESPRRYDALGVPEVIVFDPDWATRPDGVRFRVLRRVRARGLVVVEATNTDRVRSSALDCWIRAVDEGPSTRLRIGLGPKGDELFPTEAEAARAAAETARAAAETARAAAAVERAARLRAEAELARLRARLEPLRRPKPRKKPR